MLKPSQERMYIMSESALLHEPGFLQAANCFPPVWYPDDFNRYEGMDTAFSDQTASSSFDVLRPEYPAYVSSAHTSGGYDKLPI
ncbi:hypothetical protein TRAPUB_4060 [Trametes pubescens]|uniref:Uncharacterized protein n=1 Tax=Trametes pubescens TaxID=154538 RepID=A0A1M2VC32_TRAPU|nr:hypothetical protein TRAPUB_4060 [Trametes pubescens]